VPSVFKKVSGEKVKPLHAIVFGLVLLMFCVVGVLFKFGELIVGFLEGE